MVLFRKKKGSEIIDFTELYKRERPKIQRASSQLARDGVVDFSSGYSTSDLNRSDSASDFLSGLAGAGESSGPSNNEVKPLYPSPGPVTSSLRRARSEANFGDKINEMRLKLDDSDYKLNSLIEKMKELELRIREMEMG